MKAHYSSILFVVLFTSGLYAQGGLSSPFEIKAEELLEQASQYIQNNQPLKIDFSYAMENVQFAESESIQGVFYAHGDKYHMQLGTNRMVSNGSVAWFFMEDVNEVHISLVQDSDTDLTPTSLLNNFRQDFRSTWLREEYHEDAVVQIVDMVPNTPQVFHRFRLAIDSHHKIAYSIAYDRHGGSYRYNVISIDTNPTIAQGLFAFDPSKYPGIEVVDLR